MVRAMLNPARHTPLVRLLLIAFVFNALLPFFAVYQAPAAGAAFSSVFGDKVLLCTGDGFKLVSANELADQKKTPDSHKKYQCALCFVSAHGTFLGSAGGEVYVPLLTAQLAWGARDEGISRHARWQGFNTRAPPVSSMI